MEKLLLTVKATAEFVGVSPDTTGVTRIRRRTINEFLDACERAA